MMHYIVTAVLSSLMLFCPVTNHTPEKAVTFKGSIQSDAGQADQFTVTVQMDIRKGWHTYDEVGEGAEEPTSLELELPQGVTAKGDWSRPKGNDGTTSLSRVYQGKVSFTRTVVIDPVAYGKSIDVIVSYQACNQEYCNPPQNKTVSIAIPQGGSGDPDIFESPFRIEVDGVPLNTVAKERFPSPGIFDVDGDGNAELVVGGLMGSVGVYENQNTTGVGDFVWGPRKALTDEQGKPIRTSNW